MASFQALGFPTTRHEDWKYTNVEPITSQSYVQAGDHALPLDAKDLFLRGFIDERALRLVFVNGVCAPKLSNLDSLPSGVSVGTFATALDNDDPVVPTQLGRYANSRHQAFTALNTAFMTDGALITIASGCRLAQPVHLVFVSAPGTQRIISHPRVLISAGSGSEARIVESYIGAGGNYFCNAVTEIVGAADSLIEHYRIQQESQTGFHVGALAANLARGCHLTAHALSLSGALIRNNVHVVLDGEGAECALNGLYLGEGKQHIDNSTEIEHAKPHGTSLELYKGILSGNAHGVFNGKIVV
ncbi:MAG TPA: SufD family Fe-S cluster assembly protein, partial [Terriglobales bacterium]|nr:SufD family Fe-S cluster assembly protein [Terriglobales bacterium]